MVQVPVRPTVRLATMAVLVSVFSFLLPSPASRAQTPKAADKSTRDFVTAIQQAVWDRTIPGATWWVERQGIPAHGAFGFRARVPEREPITEDTLYDLASLTKVVATTPSIMLLVEQGKVRLDAPVGTYVPSFGGTARERITVRHLLTHTSGLKPGLPRNPPWTGYAHAIAWASVAFPTDPPDVRFRYSDINFILLGEIVRRVSGETLDEFAKKHLFDPLGMKDTTFNPPAAQRGRIAPTEKDEHQTLLRGVVHDPTARRMGGVAGHAGLFSTSADVARYARMILNGGELNGVRVLKRETITLMTSLATPPHLQEQRTLGWDMQTTFSRPKGKFGPRSFGHTGFTGTCLWIDPERRTFYVFLSSRLHEPRKGADVRKLYLRLGERVSGG